MNDYSAGYSEGFDDGFDRAIGFNETRIKTLVQDLQIMEKDLDSWKSKHSEVDDERANLVKRVLELEDSIKVYKSQVKELNEVVDHYRKQL